VQIRAEITPPLEGESGPIVEPAIARLLYDPKLQPFWKTGFARSMPADTVLRDAVGTTGPNAAVRWINRDGFVQLPEDSVWLSPRPASAASAVRIPALAGYRMPAENGTWPPRLVALLGGALHGKRIVLDPDGGGDASGGTGASGARGASLALAVCRALAGFLAAAGADVRLTREGDASVSEVERVQISEAFRADRFLRVGFRADAPQLGHYFSSAAGKRWAERTRLELERLSLPAPPAGENVQYPITQTSCVAMAAMLGRIDDPATEERLLSTGTLRASAYALFLGLAREFSSGEAWPLDSIAVRDEEGRAVAGAAVSIGALVLETDALGRARFARTELGALEVAVDDSRIRARGVLLDSARAFVLTGPRDR
jgi:N-acetylmuramoyl-L-alanine amidase